MRHLFIFIHRHFDIKRAEKIESKTKNKVPFPQKLKLAHDSKLQIQSLANQASGNIWNPKRFFYQQQNEVGSFASHSTGGGCKRSIWSG